MPRVYSVFAIKYVTIFLLNGSILKADPLPNKISSPFPNVNSAYSAAAEALHCFLLEV